MDAPDLERCIRLVDESIIFNGKVRSRLQEDCLSGASTCTPSPLFRTKSTVGLMLHKCRVETVVVGGPGWLSHQIAKGDAILQIDGEDTDEDRILGQLVGSDVPGSAVSLRLERAEDGQQRTVVLKRMPSAMIAERLKLFELFTELKERASHGADQHIARLADLCIETWSDLTATDSQRHENLYESVTALQNDSCEWLQMLDDNLAQAQEHLKKASRQGMLYTEVAAKLELTRQSEQQATARVAVLEERVALGDKAASELAKAREELRLAKEDVLSLKKENEAQRISHNRTTESLNFEKREIDAQLELLKKEAALASEREARLKAELSASQGQSVVANSVRSGREVKLQAEIDGLKKMLADLEGKSTAGPTVQQLEAELAARQAKLTATVEELNDAQRMWSEALRKSQDAVKDHQEVNASMKSRLLEQRGAAATSERQLNLQLRAAREREEKLKAELAAAKETAVSLSMHIESLERQQGQSSAADLDTQMLRDDAKRAAEKLAQFSAELARTSEAASSASANLQCAEQQLKESRDREEQLEAQLQAQVARISELTLELERQKATNATLGARSEEVKRCMSELRSSVSTEISEHMARASDASSRAARLQTELAALQSEMGKSTEGFKEQLESIAGLTRQLQGEKNALEKQLNEEQLENGRLRVQTKELEDHAKSYGLEIEELKHRLQQAMHRVNDLTGLVETLEMQVREQQRRINDQQAALKGEELESIARESQKTKELQTLAEKLNCEIKELKTSAKRQSAVLSETEMKRAEADTALSRAMTSLERERREVNELRAVVTNMHQQVRLSQLALEEAQDVADKKDREQIRAIEAEKRWSHDLSTRNTELDNVLKDQSFQLTKTRAENQVLHLERAILERKCANADTKCREMERELEKRTAPRADQLNETARLESLACALQEDLSSMTQQRDELSHALIGLEAKMSVSNERVSSAEGEVRVKRAELERLTAENVRIAALYSAEKDKSASVQKLLDVSADGVKDLQRQLKESRAAMEICRKETDVHRDLCSQLEEKVARANVASSTKTSELDSTAALYSQTRQIQLESEQKVVKLTAELADAREKRAMVQFQKDELDQQLKALKQEYDQLRTQQQQDAKAADDVAEELRAQMAQLGVAVAKYEEEEKLAHAKDERSSLRIQQLEYDLNEQKQKRLAAEREALEARDAVRKQKQVNVEAEQMKCSDEATRAKERETAVQRLVSARQAILQLHQAAAKNVSGIEGNDLTQTSLDTASLEEDVRDRFVQIAGDTCSHLNELRTLLMRSERRTEAMQAQIGDVEDMRLEMTRLKGEADAREARHQALLIELETSSKKYCLLKERLGTVEHDASRSLNDCAALKSELDSRTRSYKDDLAESVSEMVALRAQVEEKDVRISDLEASEKRLLSKEGELMAQVDKLDGELKERLSAWQKVSADLDQQTCLLVDIQGQFKVAQLQADTVEREKSLLEAKYAQLQQDLDATKQEVQKREAALSSANADIEKLRASGLAHEETISVMKGKIMVLEQTASRSKAEEEKALQEKQSLERNLPRLTKEIEMLSVEFNEKKAEYTATIRLFEEQLRVSMEEATRLCRLDKLLAETATRETAANERVRKLEHEHSQAHTELDEMKERLERVQAAHDKLVADLVSRTSEVRELKEEQQKLKTLVAEGENAKMKLHKDIGMMNLEVDRVREDNVGLNERMTLVLTVENQLKEALLLQSVLQTHLSANEGERKALENERDRLLLKEKELENIKNEFESLKAVSWQLVNAIAGYRQQHQGVGMCVRLANNAILIKSLEEAGAAAHSDLRCGDVLLSINGRKVAGLSVERVQSLILGPAGTEVRITARSECTGDKYTVSLLRGFAKNVEKSVVEEAEEACSAALQLQRDLAASKACLDTVCTHHRQRYLEIARLLASIVRLVKESSHDGVAFGRDGLAEILVLLDKGRGDVLPQDVLRGACEDEACSDSAKSEKSSAHESMFLSVDPDIFQRALEAEQQECNGILESLLKAVHQLLNKYQQHARNTVEVKNKEAEVDQLSTTKQHLDTQLEQAQAQKSELARKLETCNLELKKLTGEKTQLDKMNLHLTRTSTSSAARVEDLEKERDSLVSELSELNTAHRASTLKEQHLQAECDSLESHILAMRDELASVTGDLGRLITTVCAPTTGVAGVGMKVKCDDRSGVCSVKAITAGGAADCCGRIAVGDTILSVNGESVHRMTAGEVQELFQGALGSEVCISARKNQNDSSHYSATMVRSLPGVQQRKIPISEQTLEAIRLCESLHEHVRELHNCRREELRERQQLEAQRTADNEKIAALESQISALKSALVAANTTSAQNKRETELVEAARDELQGQVAALTKELEQRHACRQGELDAVEERYQGLAQERDAAKSTVEFMAERQRQCEAEARRLGQVNSELQQEISTLTAQMEALQATLKLLKEQLEETIEKEAIAVAKFTLCQQEAATMQKAIDDAKRHVKDYEREHLQSRQEIEQLQARCSDLSAQLFAKSSVQAPHSRTVTPRVEAQTARSGSAVKSGEEALLGRRVDSIAEDVHSNPELPVDMKEEGAENGEPIELPKDKAAAAAGGGDSAGGEVRERLGAAKTIAGAEKDKKRETTRQQGGKSKPAGNANAKPQTPVPRPAMTGIGMVITEKAPHRVVSLVEGGAARACGEIQMGDILLAIDDANIERLPMTYIKPMLLGETGSKVRLLLGRPSGGENFTVTLTRGISLAKSFERSKKSKP